MSALSYSVGYYFHTSAFQQGDTIFVDEAQGLFLESLSKQSISIIIFMHEPSSIADLDSLNHPLSADNITLVKLPRKRSAWFRDIFHSIYLQRVSLRCSDLDFLIIRSPSPLAPYFITLKFAPRRLIFMTVADYCVGANFIRTKTLRDILVRLYTRRSSLKFKRRLKESLVVANSPELFAEYSKYAHSTHLIKTTTVSKDSILKREVDWTGEINILFVGRLVRQKGIIELIKATYILHQSGVSIHLNIIGSDDSPTKDFQNTIESTIQALNMQGKVTLHGFLSRSTGLKSAYLNASLFVLPSYHEGFARVLWEAMSYSLPIVTTDIPANRKVLVDRHTAMLVRPFSPASIAEAINELRAAPSLRNRLTANGIELVSANTVECVSNQWRQLLDERFRS